MAVTLKTNFVFIFLQFSVLILDVHSQWLIDDDGCRTPDGGSGNCIPLARCRPINDVIDNAPSGVSNEIKNLLRQYLCGFEARNKPKVCCPSGAITTNFFVNGGGSGGGGNSGGQQAPDVSSHRNYNKLPKNCGFLDTGSRIVHGNKTALFEFPWMALLSYRTPSRKVSFQCGATIIHERYILTAAHCLHNIKSTLIGVRVGEHDYAVDPDCETDSETGETTCSPKYQDLAVEEIIIHPEYKKTEFSSDIGLIRVSSPINFNDQNIRPVCLPIEKARNMNRTNKNFIVTGWGITETRHESTLLLKAEVPNVPLSECQEFHKNSRLPNSKRIVLDHTQICAGGKTKGDSCKGDSGGPLHSVATINRDSRYVQLGIVSLGPTICGNGTPAIYTRIDFFMKWILDQIR